MIVKDGELNADFPELMNKYGGLLFDIVCLGIHNKPNDPPEWFKNTLADNTTWAVSYTHLTLPTIYSV